MKLVTTILSIILFSTGAYSQRQLLGLDPVSSRPGYIYKDTLRVLNVEAPIEKINDSTIGLDLSALAAGVSGYVQFNTLGALDADSNFFWDNSNKRLGIGTTTPQKTLHVNGKMDLGEYDATLASLNLTIKDPGAGTYLWRNTNGALSEPFIVLRSGLGTTIPGANSGGGQVRGIQGVPGIRFTDVASTTEWARFGTSGNFGIGVTTPNAVLHLKAGTTAANTAPLQFTAGAAETTARSGVMETNSVNKLFYTDGTAVRGTVQVNKTSGTAANAGIATLVAGTVTVNTTAALTASNIQLTTKTVGGTQGLLSYTIVNATSFTINSSSGTDTSTVGWVIIN